MFIDVNSSVIICVLYLKIISFAPKYKEWIVHLETFLSMKKLRPICGLCDHPRRGGTKTSNKPHRNKQSLCFLLCKSVSLMLKIYWDGLYGLSQLRPLNCADFYWLLPEHKALSDNIKVPETVSHDIYENVDTLTFVAVIIFTVLNTFQLIYVTA